MVSLKKTVDFVKFIKINYCENHLGMIVLKTKLCISILCRNKHKKHKIS